MFVPFIYELRSRRVPVGAQEAVALATALARGLHRNSLDGFYHVARALCVHSEAHLDAFDDAFLSHFKGIEVHREAVKEELWDWLREAVEFERREIEALEALDLDELRKRFEELLREQDERHDGGSKWIGTGGTSPFGHGGQAAREGYRIGGSGKHRSAIKVADARAYAGYRSDLTLDVRQMAVALRKLRAFGREGIPELDLEGTIDATARNAGDLEVVLRPPRRPNTRVILCMDVGGSMDPYAQLVSRLFSAASKASHFKELRCYYFHNCIYGHLYKTEAFRERIRVNDLLAECGKHYKLIVVGDALMAPYELMMRGGSLDLGDSAQREGIGWLRHLRENYPRSAWLNPEPKRFWKGTTIEAVETVFPMFNLTLEGLGEAVASLTRGAGRRAG
ncbi:MAG: VWA domain-containing protein [Planctomycetes bacterium]|nr:VWA domain-containing protein [Planctomycetota bacterium]